MPSGTHCPALALFRHRLAPVPPHLLWELGRGARRAGRRVRLQEHFLLAGVAPHAERGQVHRQVVLSRLEGRMRRKEDTGLKGAAGKPQIFRNLRFCSPHLSQACQGRCFQLPWIGMESLKGRPGGEAGAYLAFPSPGDLPDPLDPDQTWTGNSFLI